MFPKINELEQYQVVFWDLDNTIYPYEPAHKVALKHSLKQFADYFQMDVTTAKEYYTTARKEINTRLHGQAASHSRLLYFKEMIQNLRNNYIVSNALKFEKLYWNTFLNEIKVDKNALILIQQLYAKGKQQVIITDLTTQIQLQKIKQLKLEKYFQLILTSEEAGVEKPNAKIFEMALAKMNVKPQKCCIIGDNIKTDGGAEKLGIKTYIV